ncbi:MAG: hypothetical protein JNM63_18385, partial [Spirochaetia bacterium]|nr:hypothetical protein [Spirochaetia bacterium]
MDFLICGTAAAEGIPALFCSCEVCTKALGLGGREIRSRTAYMIGEKIRIDLGPDTFHHLSRYQLRYDRLTHLLITHTHIDHWFPDELLYRRKGFSRVADTDFKIFGNATAREKFLQKSIGTWEEVNASFDEIVPFKPISLPDGLTAYALPAAHDKREECLVFLVESPKAKIGIFHDTGWLPEASWEFLNNRKLDLALIDCTHGKDNIQQNHMGGATVAAFKKELEKRDALSAKARVF